MDSYDSIVFVRGAAVIAESNCGQPIASGIAGVDDVSVIQAALNVGGETVLDGIFQRSVGDGKTEYIKPLPNSKLAGRGRNLTTLENISIRVSNENVEISDLRIQGTTGGEAAILHAASRANCHDLCIESWNGLAAIESYANGKIVSDCIFKDIVINRPTAFGIFNSGEGGVKQLSGFRYENVNVLDAGIYENNNEWATGINIAERCDVSDIDVIDCEVVGAYESCFHVEKKPIVSGIRFSGCRAVGGGQKQGFTFGAGFVVSSADSSSIVLDHCISESCLGPGYRISNSTDGWIVLTDCVDIGSMTGLYTIGSSNVRINNFVSVR